MVTLSALIGILALHIILVLVLVLLVRGENSAFSHAWSRENAGGSQGDAVA